MRYCGAQVWRGSPCWNPSRSCTATSGSERASSSTSTRSRWRGSSGSDIAIHGDRSLRVAGAGWEYAHVAIDDASRLAYVEVLADQKGDTATAFFERARRWFARRRIRIEGVLTDNGSCYVSRRFRQALKRHEIRHLRTRAYRPQTNGKAERFIGTMLGGWAYARAYRTSNQRTKALPKWLRYYNEERPPSQPGHAIPSAASQESRMIAVNNPPETHI